MVRETKSKASGVPIKPKCPTIEIALKEYESSMQLVQRHQPASVVVI
jgi:hypothetical protein